MNAVRRSKFLSYNAYILALLVITVIIAWNAHNVVLNTRTERFPGPSKRQIAYFFSIRMYKNVTEKMAREVTLPYRESQGSLLKFNGGPKNIDVDNRLGGQAHLGHQYFLNSPPGTKNVTRWTLDSRLRSYVNGNVAYAGGCLVAAESGYYYVYSQVSFVKALRDWAANQSAATHEVIRLSGSTSETLTLLRAQKTHNWDRQLRCTLDASYLGATFYLQKGDKIFVAVSDLNFIWQSPARTYFGMRML